MTKLDAILIELEPELRQALLDAFNGIRKGVDMRALADAIERGDLDGVERALNVDEGSFAPYVLTATLIFLRYGTVFAPTLGKGIRFDAVKALPAGQTIMAENVERMTREAREIARDMAIQGMGRRETAKRIRDVIGLSRAQATYVDSMRARLESGDPAQLRAVLSGQTLRDKRYDPAIKKAIKDGKPIPPRKVDQMTQAYARKLQSKRAKDIAAAEAQQYAETSKFEAAGQASAKVGGITTKTWRHSSIYLNARPDHVSMSGVTVRGVRTPFVMADGVAMQYAHDPVGGVKHNASCRCRTVYKIVKDGEV